MHNVVFTLKEYVQVQEEKWCLKLASDGCFLTVLLANQLLWRISNARAMCTRYVTNGRNGKRQIFEGKSVKLSAEFLFYLFSSIFLFRQSALTRWFVHLATVVFESTVSGKMVSVIAEQKREKNRRLWKVEREFCLFVSYPKKHFAVTCIEVTIA